MKQPVVDYREFRLSKLNDPRFSHLKWLLGWVFYFASYILTETLIPAERCHVIHCALDDQIPFCEYFVIPYVFWYGLVAGSLLYFALYNVDAFRNLQKYFIITQATAVIVYILYPSCQNLRPDAFADESFFTRLVGSLYSMDTNTGTFPSLHCACSIAIASVWVREKDLPHWVKPSVVLAAVLICASTVFVKQHSIADFFAAIPVCILAEILVFRNTWFRHGKTN